MRLNRLKSLIVLATFSLVAVAATASATLVMPSSLEKMTESSDAVIVGRVTGQSVYRDGGYVFTEVHVDVEEYLKSDDPSQPPQVSLRVLGGELDGLRYEVAKAPVFEDGEEVLLFLKRSGDADKYAVYGLYYGRYSVNTAEDGITRTVSGPLFENQKVYNFSAKTMTANSVGQGAQELEGFAEQVRQLTAR